MNVLAGFRTLLFIAVLTSGCDSQPVPVVHVNLGSLPEEHRSFQPKASLAEYVEFPGAGAELRVLLSSHELTCENLLPLSPDQVLVSLTFSVPAGQRFVPMAFPWTAPAAEVQDGAGVSTPIGPAVLPFVRLGKHGRAIPPGGQAEITDLVLDPQGYVRGLLRFEQPGAAGIAATSLLGSFQARWCRVSLGASAE
ncbi:MAG: hypothetical protein QM784_00735 [Polyangiaceae bacterium]